MVLAAESSVMVRANVKILLLAALVYGSLFAIGKATAASCVSVVTRYAAASSGANTLTPFNAWGLTSVTTNSACSFIQLFGSEYQALLNVDIDHDNRLISQLATINYLDAERATMQSDLTNINTQLSDIQTRLQDLENQASTQNSDNILNISPSDAQTLLYATLGLFAVAYAGRQLRKSLNDNSEGN